MVNKVRVPDKTAVLATPRYIRMLSTSGGGQAARVTIPSADPNRSLSLPRSPRPFGRLNSRWTYASARHYLIYASLSQCIIPISRLFVPTGNTLLDRVHANAPRLRGMFTTLPLFLSFNLIKLTKFVK